VNFLSVCSGIEAASCALEPLGFQPIGFAETDKACGRVLAHHFAAVPNFGDFTAIDLGALGNVDMLIGGTPCQAFSVAGKRLSLADARGNLTLAFVALAHELARSHGLKLAWWENVPGVLNTPDDAFGCFLAGLVGADDALHHPAGERWPDAGLVAGPRARAAWRILDAQYFGLAQRRRRVFVVASFGDLDPAAILFERQGLQGNPAPGREAGERVAGTLRASLGKRCGQADGSDAADTLVAFGGGNRSGSIEQAATLTAKGQKCDFEVETFVAQLAATLPAGQNSTGGNRQPGTSAETAATMLVALDCKAGGETGFAVGDVPGALRGGGHGGGHAAVAFDLRGREGGAAFEGPHDTANIRAANGGSSRSYVADTWAVRRLTPTECERLQGFPDGWTATPDSKGKIQADGVRYKQLGNSMAVPVIAWIGRRILAAAAAAREA
jgi:DNA (cytosine-5)-methyltransferase 1